MQESCPCGSVRGGRRATVLPTATQLRGENWLCRSRKRRQTKPLVFLLPYFGDHEVEGSNPFARPFTVTLDN